MRCVWFNMFSLWFTVVWFTVLNLTECHTIKYVDCQHPKAIHRYNAGTVCTQDKGEEIVTTPKTLVQQKEVRRTSGYLCRVRVSRFYNRCGVWAHVKMSHIPEIYELHPMSAEDCREVVRTRRYKPKSGRTSFQINLNRETTVRATEVGELNDEGSSMHCTGETYHLQGKLFQNGLVLADYQILVREETFLIKGRRIESNSEHVTLSCFSEVASCVTGFGTFVWNPMQNNCALERIRDFRPTQVMGSYLYDHEAQVLVNTSGSTTLPSCDFKLTKTSYDGLFIMDKSDAETLKTVRPEDVRVTLQYQSLADYLLYEAELQLAALKAVFQMDSCRVQHMRQHQEPVPVQDLVYGLRRGDLYYLFKCAERTGVIEELQACYDAVPIKGGKFVDVASRTLKKHATQTVCDPRFPLTIRTEDNDWVALTPHLVRVPEPEQSQPLQAGQFQHEDLSKAGVYTTAERRAWESLMSYPSYSKALLESVTLGHCLNSGTCKPERQVVGAAQYDLRKLISSELNQMDVLSRMRNFIREEGAWLSLLVLIIIGLKILVFLVMVLYTLTREGVAAMIALVIMYTNPIPEYQKINRRKKRRQGRATSKDATIDLEQIGLTPHSFGS